MYVIDVVKLSPFCAAPRFEYPNVPSGSVPNKPLPHEAVLALFQLTRSCATLPAFTPVTVPYCELINVCWVTESYRFASKTCTATAIR